MSPRRPTAPGVYFGSSGWLPRALGMIVSGPRGAACAGLPRRTYLRLIVRRGRGRSVVGQTHYRAITYSRSVALFRRLQIPFDPPLGDLADQAFTVGAAQLDAAAGIGRLTSIATTGKSGKSGSGISWRLQPLRSQLRWKPRTLALRRRLG